VSSPKVRLYVRPVLHDRTRPFLDPVYSANRKLKPGCAIREGREQRFDSVSYYLRYLRDGKRIWEPLGSDASIANDGLRKRQVRRSWTRSPLERSRITLPSPSRSARPSLASPPSPSNLIRTRQPKSIRCKLRKTGTWPR
jgi:hypothetical protein